jgi:hypothetical protein
MPGEALLALLQNTGFKQMKLAGYTGMKSSPYTEGALLHGEKPRGKDAYRPLNLAAPDPSEPTLIKGY